MINRSLPEKFPPPGFVPGPSKIAGIEVFVPAPAHEKRPELVDFKCPKCGATVAYQIEAGGLACEYCGHREMPEIQQMGRAAEEFEFTVETLQLAQGGWKNERKELACQRCGGVVSTPPDALAFSCPFCASNKVLFRAPLEEALRPRYLIPFKVNPHACHEIARKWLGSDWLTPSGLRNTALDKFQPLYIPYWTFDAKANATWKALVGYERVEHYYDAKGQRHERRTIEWRPESGKVEQLFNDVLVPGTTHLNLTTLGRIDRYNLHDLVLFEPSLLAGMNAQAYDLPLAEAWETGRHLLRERTRSACLDRIKSQNIRNFSLTLDFSDEQWRYILVPLYTNVYQYEDKTYQILLNGQTGRLAGPRPVDWQKVWLVIAALLAPGLLLGVASLLLSGSGSGSTAGGLGLFLFVAGVVLSFFIFQRAREVEHV